jgi:xanthine dehydrogenase iron-sulfur cluster and FAD-binding subunit A
MAAGAVFTLAGEGSGQRSVAASDFFLGYRKVDMQPHEILLKVRSLAGGFCARAELRARRLGIKREGMAALS